MEILETWPSWWYCCSQCSWRCAKQHPIFEIQVCGCRLRLRRLSLLWFFHIVLMCGCLDVLFFWEQQLWNSSKLSEKLEIIREGLNFAPSTSCDRIFKMHFFSLILLHSYKGTFLSLKCKQPAHSNTDVILTLVVK